MWLPLNISFLFCAQQKIDAAAAEAAMEDHRRKQTELELQDRHRLDLEREKMVIAEPQSAVHLAAPLSRPRGPVTLLHMW